MNTNKTLALSFDLYVRTADLGTHWVAGETRTGISAFGDTQTAAVERLKEGVHLLLESIGEDGQKFVELYLRKRDIRYTLVERMPWGFGNVIPVEESKLTSVV